MVHFSGLSMKYAMNHPMHCASLAMASITGVKEEQEIGRNKKRAGWRVFYFKSG